MCIARWATRRFLCSEHPVLVFWILCCTTCNSDTAHALDRPAVQNVWFTGKAQPALCKLVQQSFYMLWMLHQHGMGTSHWHVKKQHDTVTVVHVKFHMCRQTRFKSQ
jgi:hypothetical protein